MEDILECVCDRLRGQMNVYPPTHVIACIRTHPGSIWIVRGTNLTLHSMTIRAPPLDIRAEKTWYRPDLRAYASTLRIPYTTDVFLAHYVSICLRALETYAERVTFLDVCICALHGYVQTDREMNGAPSLLRNGCTSKILVDLRRFLVEKHRRESIPPRCT